MNKEKGTKQTHGPWKTVFTVLDDGSDTSPNMKDLYKDSPANINNLHNLYSNIHININIKY